MNERKKALKLDLMIYSTKSNDTDEWNEENDSMGIILTDHIRSQSYMICQWYTYELCSENLVEVLHSNILIYLIYQGHLHQCITRNLRLKKSKVFTSAIARHLLDNERKVNINNVFEIINWQRIQSYSVF